MKKFSSPVKSFTERTMSLKMQNFPAFESLRIQTARKDEKM